MMNWTKGFCDGFIDELHMKSRYGTELGADTLIRWTFSILICLAFYFATFHFDALAIKYDQWCHEAFGWKLSDVPSQAKVEWHRLAAGALVGVGIFGATLDFSVSLYRRIEARIAASKARKESERFVS